MDRVLAYHELLIRLKQWCRLFEIWTTGRTIFPTAEVISTNEILLKVSARWNPSFL